MTINGLAVYGFGGNGISLNNTVGSAGNQVYSCFSGVQWDGETVAANGLDGILVGGPDNTIGSSLSIDANVFSGNTRDGVDITGSNAVRNVVENSCIGANYDGTLAKPNSDAGVLIDLGAGSNSIGNLNAPQSFISGNKNSGVRLDNSNNNLIANSLIGVAAGAKTALANGTNNNAVDNNGVTVRNGSSNNTIGGTLQPPGVDVVQGIGPNVVSGNVGDGIYLNGTSVSKNVIGGNSIGVGQDGATVIANGGSGIELQDAFSNLIGIGTVAGGGSSTSGNVISGNKGTGIKINTGGAVKNLIAGNTIGLDIAGGTKIANGGDGVLVGTNNNTIGSTTALNYISGNNGDGIHIDTGDFNLVAGNYIGTDKTGKIAIGNKLDGIYLESGAQSNTIGAIMANNTSPSNLISGNGSADPDDDGIRIVGVGGACNNNLSEGNFIGTDITGTAALGNFGDGISIEGNPTGNSIGSAANNSGNLISGNGAAGTANGWGIDASNTLIENNTVGLDINGKLLINKAGWLNDRGGNTLINNKHQ